MPRRLSLLLSFCACAGLALAAGCDRLVPEQLLTEEARVALKEGLAAAEAAGRLAPLDDDALSDGAAVAAVLRRPLASVAGSLGPVELTLRGRYAIEVDGAGAVVSVDETRITRLAGDGGWTFDHTETAQSDDLAPREDGRRCAWVGGRFYGGERYGPMTALEPIADEHHRCLAGATEPVVTLVRLFAERLRVDDVALGAVAGRDVLTVRLAAGGEPGLPPAVPRTYAADGLDEGNSPAIFGPRAPLVVDYTAIEQLGGTVTLDVLTGQPLGAALTGRLSLRKEGRGALMTIELGLDARVFDGEVEAPGEVVAYGPRQRIFDDRRRLLGAVEAEAVTLPGPGDAPPLRVGPSGELDSESPTPAPGADEDRPAPPPPEAPAAPPRTYDEDRPE